MNTVTFKVVRVDGEVIYEGDTPPCQVWHGNPERVSWDVEGLHDVQPGDKIVEEFVFAP